MGYHQRENLLLSQSFRLGFPIAKHQSFKFGLAEFFRIPFKVAFGLTESKLFTIGFAIGIAISKLLAIHVTVRFPLPFPEL